MTATSPGLRRLAAFALSLAAVVGAIGTGPASASSLGYGSGPGSHFVQARGDRLVLGGRTYEFTGTNNYYLGYKSTAMVDAVLDVTSRT